MTMTTLYNISDYDISNNVSEDAGNIYENVPGLYFNNTLATPYIIKDMGRINNEVYKTYIKSPTIDSLQFLVCFGCDNLGNGYALEFKAGFINLVTLLSYVPTQTLATKRHQRQTSSNSWIRVKIVIVNKKCKIFFSLENTMAFEIENFIPSGNYFGYYMNGSTVDAYVSDTVHYTDQVLWGNINLNGDNQSDGRSVLLEQSTLSFIDKDDCDSLGNWAIFVDEDPLDQTRHILLGLIDNKKNIQPKGISGITL